MGENSKIAWTDVTWNIATGCSKVDEDCKFCYMYRESKEGEKYSPSIVTRTKKAFNLPLRLKSPSKVFACSLTDFFHEGCDAYRAEAWEIIKKCPQHIFQILTKRPERIKDCLPVDWGTVYENVWMGTSVGNQKSIHRIGQLMQVPAKIRFLSIEPMHGEIDLEYPIDIYPDGPPMCCSGHQCGCMGQPTEPPIGWGLNWIIVGGESGNETGKYRYRPCKQEWIENIVNFGKSYNIPIFVKQMGTHLAKELGMVDKTGSDFEEFPESLKVREFPKS